MNTMSPFGYVSIHARLLASHRLPTDLERLFHQLKHELPQSSIVQKRQILNNQQNNECYWSETAICALHYSFEVVPFISSADPFLRVSLSLIDGGLCPLIGEWRSGGR